MARVELPASAVARLIATYLEGAPLVEAGREAGVSKEVVIRVLREEGIARRTVREQALLSRARLDGDLVDRAMARCRHDPDTGCLLWLGAMRGGQPVIRYRARSLKLRRALLEHCGRGPAPGELVWPECDRPNCLFERHLRKGTRLEHKRHLVAAGRTSRGTVHALRVAAGVRGRRKLNWGGVNDIRTRLAEGTSDGSALALEYGVSEALIAAIRNYRIWRPRELYLLPQAA